MLDTQTKRRIDDCRDILVGKLPDPKAQIEQITIGLIYKFMDDMDKEAIELGGEAKFFATYTLPNPEFPGDRTKDITVPFEQYGWDNLFNAKVTATDMLRLYSEAIAGMDKNPNIPQLFRDIFKNAFLPYRDPETLKLFLKTIGEFTYTHSEKLGDAFEYLLSVMGSQGDAGQFRTPRHIIDFMVKVVNPGKTDKILDPACGTAGFLISAFKHIQKTNEKGLTPDDRKRLIQNFVGYDISPDMVRLSLVNLYLHGFSDPHIWEYDTLSSEERWDESYDVILANPPFMSPKGGIRPHKKFSISSNRSEVLFVDYIAEHLNKGGRAGIIVPEGVIFQSGSAYKEVRKMLVDNYLYAVVSLPAGVFNPYSGVKTSILLMDKEIAKQSSEILFVKIDNDGFGLGAQRNVVKGGQLEDAVELLQQFKKGDLFESKIAHVVNKKEIEKNGDYSLSGERFKMDKVENTQYPITTLEEIVDVKGGKRLPMGAAYSDIKTDYPYIRVTDFAEAGLNWNDIKYLTKEVQSQISNYTIDKDDVYISIAGTIGLVGIIPKELDGANLTENAAKLIIKNKTTVDSKFLSIILRADKAKNQIISLTQAVGVPKLALTRIKRIEIPLPPLSIQEKIVAEIEGYQKIIDGAKAVVENYKPKIDIEPEWEMVELGEVCEHITKGTTPTTNGFEWQEAGINFIKIQNINTDGTISKDNMSSISEECHQSLKRSQLQKDDILFSIAGTQMGITGIVDSSLLPANTNQALAIIRSKGQFVPLFIKHYLMSTNVQNDMERLKVGVAQSNLSLKQVTEIRIPNIAVEIQQRIVTQIEKEQALVNANKELIQIFEQKIKDRIAKVWGKEQ